MGDQSESMPNHFGFNRLIVHFQVPHDTTVQNLDFTRQTTDIKHFAIVFHYDVMSNWPVANFRTCGISCGFLTSFYCDVTIVQLFDGPFDFYIKMKKSAKICDVRPLAIRQLAVLCNVSSALTVTS